MTVAGDVSVHIWVDVDTNTYEESMCSVGCAGVHEHMYRMAYSMCDYDSIFD